MGEKNRRKPVVKTVRDILACTVFIMAVLLFMDFGGLFAKAFGFVAKLQFWPAVLAVNVGILVLIIVLTMLFGRVYCSVLCPWGLLQDGLYRIFSLGPKKRRFRMSFKPARNVIRYGILAVYLALIAFGLGSIAYLVEPYSNFGVLMSAAKGRALLSVILVASLTLLVLILFVWKGGRLWCNTVCPVGAILGLLGRRSFFRPVISVEKCVSCGLCAKACRASCIDVANHSVDMSRCVLCMDCLDNCSSGAIEYKWSFPKREASEDVSPKASYDSSAHDKTSMSRRAFLAVTALGVGEMAQARMKKHHVEGLQEKIAPQRMVPLVPPGAVSLKNFQSRCIGCQLCVSVCPNNVLRPAVTFDSFMKPVMSFEAGFCRPECTACSDACPTGAISSLTVEQKSAVSIGHAEFSPFACVVNTDGVHCGNCARHCPTGAITMVKSPDSWNEDLEIPSIDAERCIGCGHCEYVCPARPQSAIYVEGNEVHRII